MISSGIKRGLAATAVSALAIAGVPLLATSASAVSLNSSVADANTVELLAPGTATVSAQNDGQNTTVRLEAIAGTNVTSVKFEYSLNGTDFTTIAISDRNDNGAFSAEWAANGLAGATGVEIRATGTGAGGATIDQSSTTVDVDNNNPTVNITDGTGVGVFQQQYAGHSAQNVIVKGTGSALNTVPTLRFWDSDTNTGTAGNQPDWAGTSTSTSTTPTTGSPTFGSWTGVLDITGYTYGTGDELAVQATATTDDVESFGLYKQALGTVTATADRTTVPSGDAAAVQVTVLDQNGQPIAGAEVRSSNGGTAQYTNASGVATFSQNAGSAYYYANADDSDPYEAELGDKKSDTVSVTQYAAAPTSLNASSVDGTAFDLNEYASGDITVQIKDQNNNDIAEAGRTVRYYWVETPFDGAPASERFPAGTATDIALTDADGEAVIEFPTGQADESGTYVLHASLDANPLGNGAIAESTPLTVQAGDSTLEWTGGDPAQAQAGTSTTLTGSLTLNDGAIGLAGRSVKVDYTGTNAQIVLANGTTANTRTYTTAADGTFSVTLKDPATTPPATQPEESGTLVANTVDGTVDNDDPDEGPATTDVDFLNDIAPATVTITDGTPGNVTPGEVDTFSISVRTADDPNTAGDQSNGVSNASVTLTLDHGYFTDGTPAATPVVGADAGNYKVLGTDGGKTYTVTTDGSGVATVKVAIARDAGFDDDGMVTSTLTAKAGDVTKTATHTWDSSEPLNGGDVNIEFSPASEQDAGNTPPAALPGSEVSFDVYATDQFGNLVGGELVTLSDNTNDSDIVADDADTGTPGLQVLSNFDDDGDFYTTSDQEDDQTVTASWTTETFVYTSTAGATSTAGRETLTDQETVNYNTPVITDSSVTMSRNPAGTVPVGTAVTETVTVLDENGNPVPNVSVNFSQAGPGNASSTNNLRTTNAQGQAFYTFLGATKGDAFISAVIETGGTPVTKTDTVTFGVKKKFIALQLRSDATGNKDVLKVNAKPIAEGLVAKVFVDGKKVAQHVLNGAGNHNFKITDKNGDKITTYVVKVAESAKTHAAQNQEKIK